MTLRLTAMVLGVAAIGARPVRAQLGELQVGVITAYATGEAYGPGAGLVFGIAPGRLAYAGLRWNYHQGATTQRNPGPIDVRTKVQVLALDLGVQIPAGALEIVPSVSVGINTFTQRVLQTGATTAATEFLTAPGVAVELRVGRIALIPEVQYYFVGSPNLPWRVEHRGGLASLRLVFLSEVRRIRR